MKHSNKGKSIEERRYDRYYLLVDLTDGLIFLSVQVQNV
jgi:hypothetical protein